MSLNTYLARQFGLPSGLGGTVVARVMNNQNRPMYEAAITLLALIPSDCVLDLGCGNGFVLHMAAQQGGQSFAGIDLSPTMIRSAARRNHQLVSQGTMTFACHNATAMPFPDGQFTKVYSINTVYFWDDVDAVFAEVRRVLAPGGLFVNTFYTNDFLKQRPHTGTGYQFHDPHHVEDASMIAGFDSVNLIPILDRRGYAQVCSVASTADNTTR